MFIFSVSLITGVIISIVSGNNFEKNAYEQSFIYARQNTDFSIELLCNIASILMKNTGSVYQTLGGNFSSAKGELRLLNVSAGRGGKSYISWQKVNDKLGQFYTWINEERKKINKDDIDAIYTLSFEAHYRIVSIHPWADGNGRMSRLVMNMIQYESGVIPSIVKKENRAEYISSLAQSQDEDDSSKFIDFMINHHCNNIKIRIDEYKASINTEGGQKIKSGQKKWSETTKKICNLIQLNPYITRNELCDNVGINPSAVQKHIEKLKRENIIKRIDGAKGGYWEVKKENKT